MSKSKYRIEYFSKFNEPYTYGKKDFCIRETTDAVETNSLETCKQAIDEFMDAPEAELSLEGVKKEFG